MKVHQHSLYQSQIRYDTRNTYSLTELYHYGTVYQKKLFHPLQ